MVTFTKILPDWAGEDGFILCGGTSITRTMCEAIEGRNIVAVNSMYKWVPSAPIMFFADARWWRLENEKWSDRLKSFKGLIYTISTQSAGHPNLRHLQRTRPPKMIVKAPDTVSMLRTSLSAALNIMAHKGVKRIFLLGADNTYGPSNRAHCHTEHPWHRPAETWTVKTIELQNCVQPLKELGIEVYNCSEISSLPFWPKIDFSEALK